MTTENQTHIPGDEPYPRNWAGQVCRFEFEGRKLVGILEKQEWIGFTVRGRIPDYRLVVVGKSGRKIIVSSLVESHASFD